MKRLASHVGRNKRRGRARRSLWRSSVPSAPAACTMALLFIDVAGAMARRFSPCSTSSISPARRSVNAILSSSSCATRDLNSFSSGLRTYRLRSLFVATSSPSSSSFCASSSTRPASSAPAPFSRSSASAFSMATRRSSRAAARAAPPSRTSSRSSFTFCSSLTMAAPSSARDGTAAAAGPASATNAMRATRLRIFLEELLDPAPRRRAAQQLDVVPDALLDERAHRRPVLAQDRDLLHAIVELLRLAQLHRVLHRVLTVGDQRVGDAQAHRLLAGHQLARRHELLRDRVAGPREEGVRAERQGQAALHLGGAEARVARGDDEVAVQHVFEPAGDHVALADEDHRLGRVPE